MDLEDNCKRLDELHKLIAIVGSEYPGVTLVKVINHDGLYQWILDNGCEDGAARFGQLCDGRAPQSAREWRTVYDRSPDGDCDWFERWVDSSCLRVRFVGDDL